MKSVKVTFTVLQRIDGIESRKIMEGNLVAFGHDTSNSGGSWSTGIIILPDGRFTNCAVEYITLKEPFKEEDWP